MNLQWIISEGQLSNQIMYTNPVTGLREKIVLLDWRKKIMILQEYIYFMYKGIRI